MVANIDKGGVFPDADDWAATLPQLSEDFSARAMRAAAGKAMSLSEADREYRKFASLNLGNGF